MMSDYDRAYGSGWDVDSVASANSEMQTHEPRDEEQKLFICEIDFHGTPLMTATRMGHVHEMRRLLEEGADINEYARCTRPAWTRSARYGTGCCVSALWVAIDAGDEGTFAFLLAHGASPHLEDGYMGNHAILFAAYRGRVEMVKSLLGDGADVNTIAANGRTALHCAVASGYTAMARILVEAGCDVHARNGYGYTPYALRPRNTSVGSYLRECGASDVECADLRRNYAPRTKDDVEQTAALLAHLVGRDLVQWILDLAECWVRHREQGTKKCVVEGRDDGEESELLCLTSNISGRAHNPLRKVIFKITSHDQGWRNQNGSWTWFEAGCYRDSHELSRRIITYNVPASSFPHVHIKVWECGADAGTKKWMEQFKPGDRLSIFAKARFNTWINHIDDVEVTTFCACI